MNSVYTVPTVSQNLRREETVIQIADILNYLAQVSDDIFNRINRRIEANAQQLSSIYSRIEDARVKVSNLKGAKKATQVFSSSKYPAVDIHRRYKSIFDNIDLKINRTKVKYKDVPVKKEPVQALEFYHVKNRSEDLQKEIRGLGTIPCDITSINDLLLYNTGKNPYKRYVISDPLETTLTSKKEELLETSEISAAPYSLTDRGNLTRSTTDSFFYSPDLGDVPSIDVPIDLPDLPGIADDLRYINELGEGIAPSVTTTPNMPELPPIVELLPTIDVEFTKSVPPPPPPPLIEDIIPPIEPMKTQSHLAATPSKSDKVYLPEPMVSEKIPVPNVSIEIENVHASLMEAIRKAGGAKNANLKSAPTKNVVNPSNNLMADLHAKLSLRRKGISGSKNSENSNLDAGSAMTKISAMIPPPTKIDHNELTNTEDDDWDE